MANKDKKKKIQEEEAVDTQENVQDSAKDGANDTEEKEESSAEERLNAQVADLQSQLLQKNDEYLRLMAEFDNFRRRTSKERLELVSVAGEEIIKGFLPVLDDCETAMAILKKSDAMAAAKEGTELIYSKLLKYLESKGMAEIKAIGLPLDTDFHEAVAQIPSPDESKKGLIYDVVQKGYTLNGKVIRFAKVVVAI